MDETVQRLTQAREQHEDLSQLAGKHKAQMPGSSQGDATQTIRTQNDAVRGGAQTQDHPSPEMVRPDLLMASAAGLALQLLRLLPRPDGFVAHLPGRRCLTAI